jgi:hypothetical protein
MGRSISQTRIDSKTDYTNAPITQSNVTNPFNLLNSTFSTSSAVGDIDASTRTTTSNSGNTLLDYVSNATTNNSGGNTSLDYKTDNSIAGGVSIVNGDPKALGVALDFGNKIVQTMADLTVKNNQVTANQKLNEMQLAVQSKNADEAAKAGVSIDFSKYKTEFLLVAALVAWFVWNGVRK